MIVAESFVVVAAAAAAAAAAVAVAATMVVHYKIRQGTFHEAAVHSSLSFIVCLSLLLRFRCCDRENSRIALRVSYCIASRN